VGSTAAHVALHWSARSRGYKLSREGADRRSLLRGDVCVVVLERCVFVPSGSHRGCLDVALASPFIVPKGRTRVTLVVKEMK
jgi:hypothetical protein